MPASAPSKKSPMAGLIVLIAKLAGKLAKFLPKILKGLKLGKTGMAAGSFAAYAVLFSWPFALVLMGSLFIHEMGHIWAMKRSGMKTKGVYFIPFLGAAAVSEEMFPSRGSETFIALMGPVWGFVLALLTFGGYLLTGSTLLAALAGWMAMLNLFNLLPINPLDGGRVMKSVAFSISSRAGFLFMLAGLGGAFALAWVFNLGLITFLIVIGVFELLYEIGAMRSENDRRRITAALSEALGCKNRPEAVHARIGQVFNSIRANAPDVDLKLSPPTIGHLLDDDDETRADKSFLAVEMAQIAADPRGPEGCSAAEWTSWRQGRFTLTLTAIAVNAVRPYRGVIRFWRKSYANEIWRLTYDNRGGGATGLGRILLLGADKPAMTGRQAALGFGAYLLLGAALAGLMFAASQVPAAKAALMVFIG